VTARPDRPPVRRRARRLVARAAGALALLTLGAGLLHTGPGLRLMVRLGVACPVLAVTPAAATELRAEGLATLRGTRAAPARYALGLTLGISDEAASRALAASAGESCTRKHRGFVLLTCDKPGVGSGGGAGPRRETTFAFDARDRLISVDVTTHLTAASDITDLFARRAATLSRLLGDDAERAGEAAEVARNPARYTTAIVRYRFSDYLATLTAVRLEGGVAIREQYQQAAPTTTAGAANAGSANAAGATATSNPGA
jgi:hypothetical protein